MSRTVVASACCCGITCRWHGQPNRKSKAIRDLEAAGVRVIPVCPEILGDLPCPRPPVKTRKGRVYQTDPETRSAYGREVTAEFRAGARVALGVAMGYDADTAYFQCRSPSCALNGIAGRMFREYGMHVIPIW